MKTNVLLLLGTISLIATVSTARAEPKKQNIPFQDAQGTSWNRHIVEENFKDGTTLFLVVDAPRTKAKLQHVISDRVVFRHLYQTKDPQLETKTNYYLSLSDGVSNTSRAEFEPAGRPLWIAKKNSWSASDEADYSNWIQNTVDIHFYDNAGFVVDCAEAAVGFRWVYARNHLLPVANTTETGRLLGQFISNRAWDELPENPDWTRDERFKAGLRYVLENIYTHTIVNDLYPVAINSKSVIPGTIDLILYSSSTGHTQTIQKIGPDPTTCGSVPCITVIWGNLPAATKLFRASDWIKDLPFGDGGLMKWRWPVLEGKTWKLTKPESMPDYSMEQYSVQGLGDVGVADWIYEKLNIRMTAAQKAIVKARMLGSYLSDRITLVAVGDAVCHTQPEDCAPGMPGNTNYDDYSTHSRDQRIKEIYNEYVELLPLAKDDADLQNCLKSLAKIQIGVPDSNSGLPISMSVADLIGKNGAQIANMNPDPRVKIGQRWGIDSTPDDTAYDFRARYLNWTSLMIERWRQMSVGYIACHAGFSAENPNPKNSCTATSPQVKALSTHMLDNAIRHEKNSILAEGNSLGSYYLAEAKVYFKSISGFNPYCSWNPKGLCTWWDFMDPDHTMLEQMSSDPQDEPKPRWGFL